jgi:hypothetical protein
MDQPDFTARPDGAPDLLAPLGRGPWTVLPSELELATRPDGTPDLLLELVRPSAPTADRDDAYAMLDLRLGAVCRLQEAQQEARMVDPDATVVPAALGRGWLRFDAPHDAELPAELTQPVALGFRGLADVRWTLPLTPLGGSMLRDVLLEGALTVGATALFEVAGIAPRLSMRVRAARADVAAGLAALVGADGGAPRDAVLQALRADPSALGFQLLADGTAPSPEAVAEVLCDLLVCGFATWQPGRDAPVLVPASDPGAGDLDRDLREPLVTTRPLTLALDPLAAARAAAAGSGPESLVRQTTAGRFDGGLRPLRVRANLPAERVGVVALGARIAKAPAPPNRFAAVAAAVDFAEPADEGAVTLRLAPGEDPVVDVEPYAVLQAGHRVRRLAGAVRQERRPVTLLVAGDFPLRFVRICAMDSLLQLADVAGVCRFGWGGEDAELPFALTASAPACSVALPADADRAELLLELTSVDGLGTVPLASSPATDVVVGLDSVPQYGSQSLPATCLFPDGVGLYAVDVLPDGAADGHPPQVLTFTPDRPQRTVAWFAASPFRPGLCHRPHPGPGAEPAPWSAPHPPSEPLFLTAEAAA